MFYLFLRMKSARIYLCFLAFHLVVFLPATFAQPLKARVWADSVAATLTLEQKIGQLIMVSAYSNRDAAHEAEIQGYVNKGQVGGVIFMQGHPTRQVALVNQFQQGAPIPLLVAQDAEWGISMRLQETVRYPRQMTLGAIQNDSLLYWMGARMGYECKRVGVHMNFAPVVDVNNNAANPVIHTRSFGENKFKVARKGIMIANGLAAAGVLSSAKHFPGHGDTGTDSHYDLPVIRHSRVRLDTLEFYPFSKLAEADVSSVMVSHIHVPALDPAPNRPATLSRPIIQGILRDSMGYDGLIFTDALNMQGVTKYFQPGEIELLALQAGNDILLFPLNVPKAIETISAAVRNGKYPLAELETHLRRVLIAKYEAGLGRKPVVSAENLMADLNHTDAKILKKRLYEAAMTLVKNERDLIPLANLETKHIAYLQIGGGSENGFDKSLQKYAEVTPFYLRSDFTPGERDQVLLKMKAYETVIVGMMGMNNKASENYGIRQQAIDLCKALPKTKSAVVLTLFGIPYALRFFNDPNAILVAYESDPDAEQAAAAALFGGLRVNGRLPVSASAQYPEGTGIELSLSGRFGFALPEEMGMDSRVLAGVDSLANDYIARRVMPGCAVLVMRGNSIVYEKAFGQTEFGPNGKPVDPFWNVYDLASVTKVAATTLVTMYFHERGFLNLDDPVGKYLADLEGTDKAALTLRDLLLHKAGLPPSLPGMPTIHLDPKTGQLDTAWFNYVPDREHPVAVAPSVFARKDMKDWVWERIKNVSLSKKPQTVYSDLGIIMIGRVLETLTGLPLDEVASNLFYEPLGMNRTCFNPQLNGLGDVCPPTEADTAWRHAIIQGFVHDPTAAMLGGVAGHAGLFSNVYDLAKLLLMVKNGGYYGDRLFLTETTIREFTRRQSDASRKALGWDKPDYPGRPSPVSDFASPNTYGHTGFTGTCVWVDPDNDLIFVFLSNRTYPYINRAFQRENVREKIMDKVYESMGFHRT